MSTVKKGADGTNGRSEKGDKTNWQKGDEEMQAVIIADSFNRKFSPITHELPRALLPLGNKVLIDYTIEYLLDQGVQEIIVFCCSLGEKIREYVNHKWASYRTLCNINCVMSSTSDCISLGDALREIDREGLIRSDFILVPGDLISNVELCRLMKDHKANRKKERNLVMTMVHRVNQPDHFSRCIEDDLIVAIESETNRVLYCQKSKGYRYISLPVSVLTSHKEVTIRYDLSDTHISICSPQVVPLFTDNFDYQSLDDLVKGIFVNEEILGDQVHSYVISNSYSCRINDLHMYNAVSLDYLNRCLYPLVPETKSCPYKRNNVYIENNVQVEKDCKMVENVLVGKETTIGEGSRVANSVIGKHCKIGANVCIENSYVWDDVTIEDNVSLTQSLVCSKCTVKRSTKIIDSILSFNVCVGPNVILPPSTKLSLLSQNNLDELVEDMNLHETSEKKWNEEVVGSEGKGLMWNTVEDGDEYIMPSLTGNNYDTSTDENSDDEDDESLPPTPPAEKNSLNQFYLEVLENLRCGVTENIAIDNIALEINASKFKFNISIQELCQTVSKALLDLSIQDQTQPKTEIVKEMEKILSFLQPLLLKYFNSDEAQLYSITAAEDFFASHVHLGGIFASYLHKMYDKDVIDEAVVLKWFKTPPIDEDFILQDNYDELRKNPTLIKFVTWLEEADEDSETSD